MPLNTNFLSNCTITAYRTSVPTGAIDRDTNTEVALTPFRAVLHQVNLPQAEKIFKDIGANLHGSWLKGWPDVDDRLLGLAIVHGQPLTIVFDNGDVTKGKYYQRKIDKHIIKNIQGVNEEIWVNYSDQ